MPHIIDSDLVVEYASETSTIKKKMTNSQKKIIAKDMDSFFSGDIQLSITESLTLQIIREIQIKTTMRYHVLFIGWLKLKL